MTHFARLDNNIVIEVIVAEQDFIDSGAVGDPSRWLQTSYSGRLRKRYAGIGYSYNPELDAFLPPKPYDSWVLDTITLDWIAPIEYPIDGLFYTWNEDTLSWVEDVSPLPGA